MKTKRQRFEVTLIKMIGIMIVGVLFMCIIESKLLRALEVTGGSVEIINSTAAR